MILDIAWVLAGPKRRVISDLYSISSLSLRIHHRVAMQLPGVTKMEQAIETGRKEGGLNCQKIVVGNGDQGSTKLRDCNDIAKIVSFLSPAK